jgi:PAS domain S-box-containing protein
MVTSISLLLVEDNPADAYLLTDMLEEAELEQWEIINVKSLKLALETLNRQIFDVVLLDLSLPDSKGLNTITNIRNVAPNLPIVVLTGTDDRQLALQAVTQGAQDYLVKGKISTDVLVRVIHYAIERGKILQQLQAEILERKASERTLRLIVKGTASVTGKDFFRSLVSSLAEALNVRYAFISECLDSPPMRVRTFAFWNGDDFGDNFEYDLQGTPCERVINSKTCQYYPEQIQLLFPADKDLVSSQVQSYAGIPLLDSKAQLLGHLAVLDDRPMNNEIRYRTVLEIFAARAAAEMERQQAEETLRISEEKFATAFRASPDAIALSTLDNGYYIDINDSWLQLLGYSREETIGNSAIDLGIWANPEDREQVKKLIQTQGKVSNCEFEFCKKSGEVFSGLFSAEIIQLREQTCLLTVITNITPLKQAEKALAKLAEIGELAATIVHEVRNPLNTVLMGLNAFKRLELTPRFAEYLQLSLEEGDRLRRLLNQILLYAKPQTLERSPLELNNFIREMLSPLESMPCAVGKQLQFIPSLIPVIILGDKDKLKQVLVNLVTNAFEAVRESETITIKLQSLTGDRINLQIHNYGEAIPPEVLLNLTKPFYTTKSTGNGLGLAIVKRIVEAHEGKLIIESLAKSGTQVTVQLPLTKKSES